MKRLIVVIFAFTVLPAQGADVKPAPAPAEPAASAPAAAAPEAAPAGTVARSQFTTAVQDREPVDKVTSLINDKTRVYFFTEIKDAANHRVTHRWEHDGKVVSEVGFDIGGDRWRVYSSKTLDPAQTGAWTVSVVDDAGHTLGTETFSYEAASAATSQPAASQPATPAAAQ